MNIIQQRILCYYSLKMSPAVAGGKMKFNKSEIALLAAQPSNKFQKEGVLLMREKQEKFYKRNEGWLR